MKRKKINSFFKKFNSISIIMLMIGLFCTIPVMIIFVFGLNKKWYDGLSVCGAFYIGISILCFIFDYGKFNHWSKIKNIFVIKTNKTNNLTEFEKKQMKILNVKYDKTDDEKKKHNYYHVFIIWLIFGITILIISLPFLFI